MLYICRFKIRTALNSIINNYMINIKYINLIRNKEIVGECKLQQINDTETWLENVLI